MKRNVHMSKTTSSVSSRVHMVQSQRPDRLIRRGPLLGDIVIRKEAHSPAAYLLSRFARQPQFLCRTYEEAAWAAEAVARTERVDAWCTSDGKSFELITPHSAINQH